jgi:hypothetical protein
MRRACPPAVMAERTGDEPPQCARDGGLAADHFPLEAAGRAQSATTLKLAWTSLLA